MNWLDWQEGESFSDWVERQEREDPEYAEAAAAVRAEHAGSVDVSCHYGNCSVEVSRDGRILGGMGPVLCPCDHLPGWKARHPAGTSKPHPPVKARGRHGSRVQRSNQRHLEPAWIRDQGGFLR